MSLDQLVDQKEILYPRTTYLHGSGKKLNNNNFLLNKMIRQYSVRTFTIIYLLYVCIYCNINLIYLHQHYESIQYLLASIRG